ncbi:hypothetical protein [Wolbachia pipientis]|uniref:hypothetical protein n=1 Tax=Wolbachia pipientis TaxID=955 RepID=UPI00164CADB4|nr:hypothetical protein [Wolbachia pipientis]
MLKNNLAIIYFITFTATKNYTVNTVKIFFAAFYSSNVIDSDMITVNPVKFGDNLKS